MSEVRSTTSTGEEAGGDRAAPTAAVPGRPASERALLDRLMPLGRARIPERVVHAKGWGAFGTLTVTRDITRWCRAGLFSAVGKTTDVLIRFSTFAGEAGAADAERDVRGFAVRFYTEEGNWDLVGINTPVFFIRDPAKFADLVRSQKRDPRTNLRSPEAMWDFFSSSPESLHQVTFLFADRGLPVAPQYMNGHGAHTYAFRNAAGARFWVKFHFETRQGHRHYTASEVVDVIGQSRESSQEELYGSIGAGRLPRWTMRVQVIGEDDLGRFDFDPFDLTKVWPHALVPSEEVGVIELNRNADDYFAEIEQAAFSPAHLVPGIEASPDPMLRVRLLSYGDAHRHRLGPNHDALPVNAPRHPLAAAGAAACALDPEDFAAGDAGPRRTSGAVDDFTQPRALFALFDAEERGRLFANLAAALVGVSPVIVERQLALFAAVHPDYAEGVRRALRIG